MLNVYLLSAAIYSLILFCSFGLEDQQGLWQDWLFYFGSSFFCFFLIAFNGNHARRLLLSAACLALVYTLCFIYPSATFSSFVILCLSFFAAVNLLTVYHKANRLSPAYPLFFYEAWTNTALVVATLVFALSVFLIIMLFIGSSRLIGTEIVDTFFSFPLIKAFTQSVTLIMGLYLCRNVERIIAQVRLLFLSFGRIFFVMFFIINTFFLGVLSIRLCVWALNMKFGLTAPLFEKENTSLLITTFFSLGFFPLIFFNTAYPYEEKENSFSKRLEQLCRYFPFVTLLLMSLDLYLIKSDIKALVIAGEKHYLTQENLQYYYMHGFLWLYYAAYSLGIIINPKNFMRTILPKINEYLALLFVLSSLLLMNRLVLDVFNIPLISLPKPEIETPTLKKMFKTKPNMLWLASENTTPDTWEVLGQVGTKALYGCLVRTPNAYAGQSMAGKECIVAIKGKANAFKNFWIFSKENAYVWGDTMPLTGYVLPKGPDQAHLCRTMYNNRIYLGHVGRIDRFCIIVSGEKTIKQEGYQRIYLKTPDMN